MNKPILAMLAWCVTMLSGCMTVPKPDQDARAAAVEWLALVDAKEYHKAYLDRPARIVAGASEEDFVRYMNGRRAPLGKTISRAFYRVSYSKKLVGSPDGSYGFMTFKTRFEHKAESAERITVSGENGRWQVSGYSIY